MAQTAVGGAKSFADSLSYEKSAIESSNEISGRCFCCSNGIAQAALEKGRDGGESYATGVASAEGRAETLEKICCKRQLTPAAIKKNRI